MGDELLPGVAASIEDGVVIFEDAVCEVVLAKELPDIFRWVEFWRVGRQGQKRDVVGNIKAGGLFVIAGAVHDDDGVSAGGDRAADFRQMYVHRFRIGARQNQACGAGALGADCAEQIRPFVTLIPRRLRTRPASRPAPGQAAFLADARFVPRVRPSPARGQALEPDLDRLLFGVLRYDGADKFGEVFLNAS